MYICHYNKNKNKNKIQAQIATKRGSHNMRKNVIK